MMSATSMTHLVNEWTRWCIKHKRPMSFEKWLATVKR
jgi:hypothetical protein